MPRIGQLEITRDKQSKKWVLNISAKLSKTGRKRRLKFATKAEAERQRKIVAASLRSPVAIAFDQQLFETAAYYRDAFQLYGFKGLDDACAAWIRELDRRSQSLTLEQLIDEYQEARSGDWSKGYLLTFNWAKGQLVPLHPRLISELDALHWQKWLPKWRKANSYAARSFNHLRTFLVSIYGSPSAVEMYPNNPIKQIPVAKIKKQEVSIAQNKELKALFAKAMRDDPEMVPWLAVAFFAGLRPESELKRLDWKDINFEENWIRVGFGNKTDTKRFVDLSENLAAWLKPFAQSSGKIRQTNHRKRKDALVEGTLSWERDISRHSYGSNLEARARAKGQDSRAVVLQNMGHTAARTFEQHYRNARTAKQALAYWSILPPGD